jgi:hypothetical protein
MKAVEDHVRHGIDSESPNCDRTQQGLPGHRCCRKHHCQGEAERTNITNQVLVVRRKQRDPSVPRGRKVAIEARRRKQRPAADECL